MRYATLISSISFAAIAVIATAEARAQTTTRPSAGAHAAAKPALTTPAPPIEPRADRFAGVYGVKGGLTADRVADRAVATSPEIRQKSAAIDVASGEAEHATMAIIVPRIDLRARYARLSPITQKSLLPGVDGTLITSGKSETGTIEDNITEPLERTTPPKLPVILNNISFDAIFTVPLSDYALRLVKVLQLGETSVRAAELEKLAARATVATTGRLTFYEWARVRGQAIVAEQGVEQAKSHLSDAQHGLALGVVTPADALRAEAQVKRSELLLSQARHGVILAEERVRSVMHEPPGGKLEVGDDLLGVTTDRANESVDNLQAEAARRRLELRALDEAAKAFRQSASVKRVDLLPRVDGFAGATMANPNQRYTPQQREFLGTWEAGAVLSWSPTEIPRVRAAAAADEARAEQVAARRDSVRDAVRLEVLAAWHATIEAREAVTTSEQTLSASEESYRMRRELYRGGRASYVEISDAETDVTRARLDDVSARIDVHVARARLAHAVGRDTD